MSATSTGSVHVSRHGSVDIGAPSPGGASAPLRNELMLFLAAQRDFAAATAGTVATATSASSPAASTAPAASSGSPPMSPASPAPGAEPIGRPLAILQRRARLLDQFLRSPIDLTAPTSDTGRADDRELLRRRDRHGGVEGARFDEIRSMREARASVPNIKITALSGASSSGGAAVRPAQSRGAQTKQVQAHRRSSTATATTSSGGGGNAARSSSRKHLYRGLSVEQLDEKIAASVEALDFHEAIALRDHKYETIARVPPLPTTPPPPHHAAAALSSTVPPRRERRASPPGLPSTAPPLHPTHAANAVALLLGMSPSSSTPPASTAACTSTPRATRFTPPRQQPTSASQRSSVPAPPRASPLRDYTLSTPQPLPRAVATTGVAAYSYALTTAQPPQQGLPSFVGASPLLQALANTCSPTRGVERTACPRLDALEDEMLLLAHQLHIGY